MNITGHIAKHFREVHYGGNWTWVNLKDTLSDVSWQQATTKVNSMNTIATLVFHMNYFVVAALEVLNGRPLNAHDKFSFDHPPINSQEDWDNFLQGVWQKTDEFASLIEKLPEDKLLETFELEKYGTYYRNLAGIIEHCHYHLGQIVILKKVLSMENPPKAGSTH